MKKKNILTICFFAFFTTFLTAQNAPVILEAEAAALGSDFQVQENGPLTYISITSNAAGGNPQSADRVASFQVTFPSAQSYDLYIRCRVGPNTFDDDSFYYGNGFGEKSPTSDADWIRVNNIANAGYANPDQFVDGGGATGPQVWKWINLSEFTGDETPLVFEVSEDGLTQTFQIGAREDGLDIDKIAFARADYFFTVSNLNNGEEGSSTPDSGPAPLPIATGGTKFLGNIYSGSQLEDFTHYWNQVTPENAGKWGSVEQTRDNMNWAGLDAAYALAKDNDFPFRLHVLVWGNQQPAWIENLPAEEQLEEIKEWMQALADRYPDIDYVEVVNEPLHDPPNQAGEGGGNYINALGGAGTTGWDWVLESFRLAREYFPDAQLMVNDYNIVNNRSNVSRYLGLINLLKAENLIDQIGVQGHAFSTRGSTSEMERNLDELAATGLPIQVTEFEIDGPTDQTQLSDYQRIFPIFWEHPAVIGVTLWGFRPGLWRNEQRAYLIETDGFTERPALEWLRSYVESTITTSTFQQQTSDHIKIYPNPLRSDVLTVEGMDQINRAELFTVDGQRIWWTTPTGNRIRVGRDLNPGMYILQLYGDQYVFAKKLMIQRR
jgi:endo-1,4-beta-xylanase